MTRPRLVPCVGALTLVLLGAAGCGPRHPAAAADDPAPAPAAADGPKSGTPKSNRYALLVGVTTYPNLDKVLWLDGPANDLALMTDLLRKHGFAREDIEILSEQEGQADARRLPTRANIEREIGRLVGRAAEGTEIVLYLSGHGSRQPAGERSAEDPDPDGYDNLFLPRDIGKWEDERQRVPNGISGHELGKWLRPVPAKKAALWVVMDSCFSGRSIRPAREHPRTVSMKDLGIPEAARVKAEEKARKRNARGPGPAAGAEGSRAALRLPNQDGVAILYACQPTEEAFEVPVPPDDKYYGLLTYALSRVVARPEGPLTYGGLAKQVARECRRIHGRSPTPLLEVKDPDREAFGTK